MIYPVCRPKGLDAREAECRWDEHAPLARWHHVGMPRHAQSGVNLPLTADASVVHGFAMLRFPTDQDLLERMYDSADGQAVIAADALCLVGNVTSLRTGEYIVRDPPVSLGVPD